MQGGTRHKSSVEFGIADEVRSMTAHRVAQERGSGRVTIVSAQIVPGMEVEMQMEPQAPARLKASGRPYGKRAGSAPTSLDALEP